MKVAILVLADTESHGDMGRVTTALEATKEFQEAGDDVVLIFDGAGTTWIPKLADNESQLHPLFKAVEKSVKGACEFCAHAFGVREKVEAANVPLLSEYDQHPSIRNLVKDGDHVIPF